MFPIDSFSAIISLSIILFLWPVATCLPNIADIHTRAPYYRTCIIIGQSIAMLSIIAVAGLYIYVVYCYYIPSIEQNNNDILATKTNCHVDQVDIVLNSLNGSTKYLVWYSYNNITKMHYSDLCDIGFRCWPNVNDTITCWPLEVNSVVTYVLEPPLKDISFYKRHFNWGIAQAIFCLIGLSVAFVTCIENVRKCYQDFVDLEEIQIPRIVIQQPPPPPLTVTVVQAEKGPVCAICLENQPSIMYSNCKHVCLCEKCSIQYNNTKCPICAQISLEKVTIFFPATI
jgi:hypothetical protein